MPMLPNVRCKKPLMSDLTALHVLNLLILKPLIRISLLMSMRNNSTSLGNRSTLGSKWSAWEPSNGFAGLLDLVIELVDLLESKAFGLVDEEVNEADTQKAAAEPDEEDLGLQVGVAWSPVDEVRGGVGDGPVEEPLLWLIFAIKRGVVGMLTVGCGGHGQALCADLEWEDLAGNDPSDWSPSGGKEEDEDTDEGNGSLLSSNVLDDRDAAISLTQCSRTQNSDKELRDGHADGTPEEKWTSAPLVNGVEPWKSGRDVDGGGDHLNGKGVLDAGVLEEAVRRQYCAFSLTSRKGYSLRSVVEDKVHSRELLEDLKKTARKKTLSDIALKAIKVSSLSESQLKLVVGLNLIKLVDNRWVVGRKATELRKSLECLVMSALLDQVTWSFWKDDHSHNKNNGVGELHRNWDSTKVRHVECAEQGMLTCRSQCHCGWQ